MDIHIHKMNELETGRRYRQSSSSLDKSMLSDSKSRRQSQARVSTSPIELRHKHSVYSTHETSFWREGQLALQL